MARFRSRLVLPVNRVLNRANVARTNPGLRDMTDALTYRDVEMGDPPIGERR